jgi:hypothetical protein
MDDEEKKMREWFIEQAKRYGWNNSNMELLPVSHHANTSDKDVYGFYVEHINKEGISVGPEGVVIDRLDKSTKKKLWDYLKKNKPRGNRK